LRLNDIPNAILRLYVHTFKYSDTLSNDHGSIIHRPQVDLMTIRELYVIKEFVSGSPIYHLAFKEVDHFENLQGVWHDEV